MTEVIVIAAYVAVAYVVAVVSGMLDYDEYFAFILSVIWPVSVPILLIIAIGDKVCDWIEAREELRRRIGSVLYVIFLPFRPRQIGIQIASLVRRLRNSRKEGCAS